MMLRCNRHIEGRPRWTGVVIVALLVAFWVVASLLTYAIGPAPRQRISRSVDLFPDIPPQHHTRATHAR